MFEKISDAVAVALYEVYLCAYNVTAMAAPPAASRVQVEAARAIGIRDAKDNLSPRTLASVRREIDRRFTASEAESRMPTIS